MCGVSVVKAPGEGHEFLGVQLAALSDGVDQLVAAGNCGNNDGLARHGLLGGNFLDANPRDVLGKIHAPAAVVTVEVTAAPRLGRLAAGPDLLELNPLLRDDKLNLFRKELAEVLRVERAGWTDDHKRASQASTGGQTPFSSA